MTDRCVVPPGPVHERLYVAATLSGPTLWLPFGTDLFPDHAPLPVQLVALVVVQLRVLEPPTATETGLAEKFTVGGGVADATVTVTERAVLPPCPFVQVNVKVVLAVSPALVSLPLVDRVPLHPPLAVQPLASVLDQVSVVVAPLATEVGLAESVTVGTVVPLPGL